MQEDTIKVRRVFGEGLAWFMARPLFWIGTILLFGVISTIANTVTTIFPGFILKSGWGTGMASALMFFLLLVNIFITTRMGMGLGWMAISTIHGQPANFADLFAKPHLFWRYLGTLILFNAIVFLGLIFFVVPGIYLAARFFPVPYIMIERETGILEAFRQAEHLTEGHRATLSAFIFLGVAIFAAMMQSIQTLGGFALLVVVIAAPIALLSFAALYGALKRASGEQAASA